ncbi:MAG: host specificity protein J [Verrucomicrobia bacterium]|nr:host specificity protein J [Verrucomicrobiota bacterium]
MSAHPVSPAQPLALLPAAGSGGGGKGGGAARAAVEAPDSLRSNDYVRVLGLLSAGPIFGPTDPDHPLRCLYLDDTPVEASDGTRNFKDLKIYFLPGTVDQSYIPGFTSAESATSVNVQVETASPWTQAITDTTADAVRVTVSLPAIYKQDTSNGDIGGTSVQLKIQRRNSGGSYTDILTDTINGKQRSNYKRSYRIPLPAGTGPWDIRVVRLTADSAVSSLVNDTYVDSYSLIYEGKFSYPYCAQVGIDINAEQFSRIPIIAADVKGLLVRVPSNYNPTTRVYTGTWDGTFSAPTWTNNPAWVFYDLLTHPRYGLGKFIPEASVDKWKLYAIAQYCDELVDDGDGGTEPRFTCNLVIQTRQEALKVMADIASIFRGMVYFAAGLITPTQDAPADPVAQFSRANVIPAENGDHFVYRGSALRARHTVALVTWNNLANLGRLETEYVEDSDAVERFGVRELNVTGFGCTSRGQANRIGKWALAVEQRETDTVTFRASLEAAIVVPGDIIETSDPARAGRSMAGRIQSATTSSVVLDRSVLIESGQTYELSVYPPDGSAPVSRPVTTSAGTVSTLAVSPAFASAPLANTLWVLKASNLQPEQWRVITVAETENPLEYDVTALQHDPTKYAAVEQDLALDPPPTSLLPSAWSCQPPVGPIAFEMVYRTTEISFDVSLEASWGASPDPFLRRYAVLVRKDGGNWEHLPDVSAPEIRIPIDTPGNIEVEVVAVNSIGGRSAKITADYDVSFAETVFDVAQLRVRGADVKTCTGTASTDVVTCASHGLVAADVIVFLSVAGGTGLTAGTPYFVLASGLSSGAFKLSATDAFGSAVNITADFTGATFRRVSFDERELELNWDVTPPAGWYGPAVNDPFFSHFEVKVETKDSSNVWNTIRTDDVEVPQYIYTAAKMSADFPPLVAEVAQFWPPHLCSWYSTSRSWGQWARLRFGVRCVNRFGDASAWVYVSPYNRIPAEVTNLAGSITSGVLTLTWEEPAAGDIYNYVIVEQAIDYSTSVEIGSVPVGTRQFHLTRAAGTNKRYLVQAYDWFHQLSGTFPSVTVTF